MSGSSAGTWISLALTFGLCAAFVNPMWQDPQGAVETLDNAGYTNVETGGYGWFSCGKGDLWHTKFTATNQNGKEISGVVCQGVFKGSTIRFD